MPKGTITARKIGVLYAIVTTVPRTLKIHWYKVLIVVGRLLSTVSISREKRLTIRPIGVVSKNDMGAFRMWSNNLKWRMPAALTICVVEMRAKINTKIPARRQNTQSVLTHPTTKSKQPAATTDPPSN